MKKRRILNDLDNFHQNIIKKFNIQRNHIMIYGFHPCKSALENSKREKLLIFTNKKNNIFWKNQLIKNKLRTKLEILSEKELDKLSKNKVHQSIIIFALPSKKITLKQYLKENDKSTIRIILLDQINDPQNVGAIIRSAFAFNFDAVGVTKNKSPGETSSLIKASSGEIEKIFLIEIGNLVNEIKLLKANGFFVYGLANEGKIGISSIEKNQKKIALVIGSEGKGLRVLTKKNLDSIYNIPINKQCDSLNASNAAAIAMYELKN